MRAQLITARLCEEKAHAREQDPERQQALRPAKAMMADMFGGPPSSST
jgi:hypothetical protein